MVKFRICARAASQLHSHASCVILCIVMIKTEEGFTGYYCSYMYQYTLNV